MSGLSDRQDFSNDRFFIHDQISERVGSRRADQTNVDWKRSIEKPRAAIEFDSGDKFLRRGRVQPPTLMDRVNERAEPHMGDAPWATGGDVPQQLADDSLRKVVRFNLPGNRHPPQSGSEPPVSADNSPNKSSVGEVIETSCLTVSLSGSVDECQIVWPGTGLESPFDGGGQGFCVSGPDKAPTGDGLAVLDQTRRVIRVAQQSLDAGCHERLLRICSVMRLRGLIKVCRAGFEH